MNKNLPHIDEVFRDGIDPYEEHPSPDVWQRLQAQLDKDDATVYKRRYIVARRAAISLAVLLLFLVIQETGIIRPAVRPPIGSIRSQHNMANNAVKDIAEGQRPRSFAARRKSFAGHKSNIIHQPDINYPKEENNSSEAIHSYDVIRSSGVIHSPDVIHLSGYIMDSCRINGKPDNTVPYVKLSWPDSLNRIMAGAAGQKGGERRPFRPYWSVTALASQELAQYRLENNGNAGQDESAEIAQKERHEPSFTAGALILYQFKRKWGLQTGLIYSSTSIAIDPQEIYAIKAPDGAIAYKYNSSSGYALVKPAFGLPPAVGDSLSATSAQHNLQYIGVPITLQYKITKGRFSFSPGLGVSFNFLTGARIKTEVEDALSRETVTLDKLQGTKTFYLGLMANVNMQYDFSRKWALAIRPGFSYALTSITKNNVVKNYPYSLGAAIGITYKF